jgi:hypothetical protein
MSHNVFFRACADGDIEYVREHSKLFVPTTLRRACLTAAVHGHSDIVNLFYNHMLWSAIERDILHEVYRTGKSEWALKLAASLLDKTTVDVIRQLVDSPDSTCLFAAPGFVPVEPWSE